MWAISQNVIICCEEVGGKYSAGFIAAFILFMAIDKILGQL